MTIQSAVYDYLAKEFGDKFVGNELEFFQFHAPFMKEQQRKSDAFDTALKNYMKNDRRYMSLEDRAKFENEFY